MKLRSSRNGKPSAGNLLTNQAMGLGAILWAAGIEHRAGLVNTSPEAEPPDNWRRQHPKRAAGKRRPYSGSGGVVVAARRNGVHVKLERPSWSQGERPWSKVVAGNSGEDQRAPAWSIVATTRGTIAERRVQAGRYVADLREARRG
jgi:hypothetical protein